MQLYEILKNSARAVVERHHLRPNQQINHYLSSSSSSQQATTTRRQRLPPIHVRIAGGADAISIRISDEGGGISSGDVDKAMQFGWTTINNGSGNTTNTNSSTNNATSDVNVAEGLGVDNSRHGPLGGADFAAVGGVGGFRYRMAGLGFGLPLSRLYARYFGGDLQLVSTPGYGVDVFLSVKRLEGDWGEEATEESTPLMGTGAAASVVGGGGH